MVLDLGRRVREWLPAVLVLAAMLVGWQVAIEVFDIQRFLLPSRRRSSRR